MKDSQLQAIAKTEAHLKQEADILEEEEEAYQEKQSSTYWSPHQQCHEEPPLPKMCKKLKETMSDFHSHCKTYNQQLQSTMAKTEVHFKQILEILKDEALQDQLVTILKGHYMEDECIFYYEQAITTLRGKEVVEDQVEERKEEPTKVPQELHQEKEESTETSSTLALILEIQRV